MAIDVNGIGLHYETTGEGEPLLWLHGFFGAGSDWRYIFDSPPPGFQIIAPDLRGHGRSTNPSCRFTFREAAGDVAALLRHLGIDRVKAIGISGGGIVLLHMATTTPSTIESMVLVSAPPFFPEQARAIQRRSSEAMFSEAEMTLMRARHPGGDQQIRMLIDQSRAFADNYDDVNFTPPLLGRIEADTLILFGDRDPLYPVTLALDLRAAISQSYLWIAPNGGHCPIFLHDAARFRETAMPFIRGAWRPPRM